MPIYMKFGANTGRQKIVCEAVRFDHQTASPPPDQWLTPMLQKTQHTRMTILQKVTPLDKGLPPLQANEQLPGVQIEVTNGLRGSEQIIRIVNLGRIRVARVTPHVHRPAGNFNRFDLELIELVLTPQQISSYSAIFNSGKTFIDGWE